MASQCLQSHSFFFSLNLNLYFSFFQFFLLVFYNHNPNWLCRLLRYVVCRRINRVLICVYLVIILLSSIVHCREGFQMIYTVKISFFLISFFLFFCFFVYDRSGNTFCSFFLSPSSDRILNIFDLRSTNS